MNATERIQFLARKYAPREGQWSEVTVDLLIDTALQFDVVDEIEKALKGEPSKLTEEVAEALGFTAEGGGSLFDSKFDE